MNLEGMNLWIIDAKTLEKKEIVSFAPFRTSAKGHNYKTHKTIKSFAEKPVEAAFSGNGKYVWTSFHNGSCVVRYNLDEPNNQGQATIMQKARILEPGKKSGKTIMMPKIMVKKTPKIVTVTPDEKYVLVANWFGNSVSVIDNKTLKKIKDIRVGPKKWPYIPRGICVNSSSTRAYVANMRGGTISILDLTALEKIGDLKICSNPRHVAISNDDKFLYITNNAAGQVIKYDLSINKISVKKYIGPLARTLVLSPDNKYVYAVSHKGDKIVILDSSNLKILASRKYYRPMGISISPDGKHLWVSSYTGGYVTVFAVIE